MDAEALKRIDTFLTEYNQSLKSISKIRLVQFQKIDAAIQTRINRIVTAVETLKGNSINVSAIASDSGISRKTFYNNDLLRLYVEKYACDPDQNTSASELQHLKARNDQYKEQVKAFLLRDIETENLRHENIKLTHEISNLQMRNKNLEEQYAALLKETQMLRSKLAEQPGHITQFPASN